MVRIGYLARGQAHVHDGTETRTLDSEFGQKVRDRAVSIRRRNAWKTQARGARFAGAVLAGAAEPDPAAMRIAVSGCEPSSFG